jgi:hypothetical protein
LCELGTKVFGLQDRVDNEVGRDLHEVDVLIALTSLLRDEVLLFIVVFERVDRAPRIVAVLSWRSPGT